MSPKLTTEIISKIALLSIFWLLLAVLSAPVMATNKESSHTAKSISFMKNAEPDETTKNAQLSQKHEDIMAALKTEGYRIESTAKALHITTSHYVNKHNGVSIYNASTILISDVNNNGFYHRFSVTVDADTTYNTAYIYARLYLSFEGRPWKHYATSGIYHIHSNSEADTFVIETELSDGFSPGYYDVRIELYDADNNHWLLSYGSYDDASLSALPLEDSYHDDQYDSIAIPVETVIEIDHHGGSAGWLLLLLAVVITTLRQVIDRSRPQHNSSTKKQHNTTV